MKEAANAHDFAGYDYSPLEEGKIVDFIDKLNELVRKAESDLKKLQVSQLEWNVEDQLTIRAKEQERRELCRASWTVSRMSRLQPLRTKLANNNRSYVPLLAPPITLQQ